MVKDVGGRTAESIAGTGPGAGLRLPLLPSADAGRPTGWGQVARALSAVTGTHLAFRAGLDRALPWLSRAADPELGPRGILELTGGPA